MSVTYSSGAWVANEGEEEEEFVSAWTEFARWLATMPGSGTARLTRDLREPRRYMSFAPWESVEALQAWRSNPEFPERMAAVQEHVAEFSPTEYELVAEV